MEKHYGKMTTQRRLGNVHLAGSAKKGSVRLKRDFDQYDGCGGKGIKRSWKLVGLPGNAQESETTAWSKCHKGSSVRCHDRT